MTVEISICSNQLPDYQITRLPDADTSRLTSRVAPSFSSCKASDWPSEDDDVFRWVRRFEKFPKSAGHRSRRGDGQGRQPAIVRQIAGALTCRVGGGVRTVERARDLLDAGARQIIAGPSLQERRA